MLSANSSKIRVKDKVSVAKHLWFQIFRTETPLDSLNICMICTQNDKFQDMVL